MDGTVTTPRQLTAALGAGFYRYWHVPGPHAVLDIRETRRADLSVIGPGALALLALGTWTAGRVGTAMLMHDPVTAPFGALPWTARLLVLCAVLGVALAGLWWLGTAPVRARVAEAVAAGSVARIPDDPVTAREPLHAAVTELGRTLRDLPGTTLTPPLTDPAFEVLRTAASMLAEETPPAAPEQRRLRRRCVTLAHRLQRAAEEHASDEPAAA